MERRGRAISRRREGVNLGVECDIMTLEGAGLEKKYDKWTVLGVNSFVVGGIGGQAA